MLIVNVGVQGMTKVRYRGGDKPDCSFVIEHKTFPTNVPVECSDEMAVGLLKKYNNPNMAIVFRSADGFALSETPVVPVFPYDAEEPQPVEPIKESPKLDTVFIPKRRGRPRKQ